MQAVIVQLGGYYAGINKQGGYWNYYDDVAHMMLITNRSAPMNDEATTTGGYLASKMHKEIMPALTAELEEAIGETHVRKTRHFVPNTNSWNAQGKLNYVEIRTKLELFSLYDLFARDNIRNGNKLLINHHDNRFTPYALFRHPLVNSPLNLTTWLMEPVNDASSYSSQFLKTYFEHDVYMDVKDANSTQRYCARFLLHPGYAY